MTFKIGTRVDVGAAHSLLRGLLRGTVVEVREARQSVGVLLDTGRDHARFYRPRYVTVLGVVDLLAELVDA